MSKQEHEIIYKKEQFERYRRYLRIKTPLFIGMLNIFPVAQIVLGIIMRYHLNLDELICLIIILCGAVCALVTNAGLIYLILKRKRIAKKACALVVEIKELQADEKNDIEGLNDALYKYKELYDKNIISEKEYKEKEASISKLINN